MQKLEKKLIAKFVEATIGRTCFEGITKKQKGITLIALIITIIVMMILVGVTVSVSLNGELFYTARRAAQETEKEADREELQLAVVGAYDVVTGTENITKLKSNLLGWTVEGTGPYTCTSTNGNKFKVAKNGQITEIPEGADNPQLATFPYGTYYMGGVRESLEGIVLEEDTYKYLWLMGESATTEIIDDKNAKIICKYVENGEEYTDEMHIKYFVTNDDVIFLLGSQVFCKTGNDITFGLSGYYVRESDGLVRLHFNNSSSYVGVGKKTSADETYFSEVWEENYSYCRIGDKYYFNTGDEFTVSADGKTLTCNGVTYINESGTSIEEKEQLEFITPEGSDFIYGTYYEMTAEGLTEGGGIVLEEDAFMEAEIYENVTVDVNEDECTITVALSEEESISINYIKTENNVILNSEDWGFTVALSETDLLYDLDGEYINADRSQKITFNENFVEIYRSWNSGVDWSIKDENVYCGYDGTYCFGGEKFKTNADKTTLIAPDGTVYTKQ